MKITINNPPAPNKEKEIIFPIFMSYIEGEDKNFHLKDRLIVLFFTEKDGVCVQNSFKGDDNKVGRLSYWLKCSDKKIWEPCPAGFEVTFKQE